VSDELTWMPAWQIRELIGKSEVSPVEVTEHFLGRIEEFDGQLHTFKTLDVGGAREQARTAEAAVVRGDELGTLHGIPVSVKEHIAVAGLPLMQGPSVAERISTRDALGVGRVRDAGAVMFGTNTMMATSGGGVPSEDGPGVYSLFNWDAEARNPWDVTRVPGWSSSGGAAATASRLIPIAIGSDGGGSTRLPAAYSGVVGMHPTPTLIPWVDYDNPRHSYLMMTIGPLARNVVDAAVTLQAMAGPDGRDFTCQQAEPADYLARISAGVEDMRLAWTDDFGFTDMYAQQESPRVIAAVREAAQGFSSIGASVEPTGEAWEDFFPGFFTHGYLYPTGGPQPPTPGKAEWAHALDSRQRNWQATRRVLADHDVILSATSQLLPKTVPEWNAAWVTDGSSYGPHGTFAPYYTSHTHMFNWIGFPAASVPCGFVDGLPVGLQVIGLPGREDTVLRVANAFQQAFPRDEHPPVS
jgi:Asp-tRNA(Asn)/Glu-tRNA(Gln) amidotransferase A subunit family amidase